MCFKNKATSIKTQVFVVFEMVCLVMLLPFQTTVMKEELRIFFCTFSTKLFKVVIKITNILSEFEDKKIDKNIDEQYYRVLNQI